MHRDRIALFHGYSTIFVALKEQICKSADGYYKEWPLKKIRETEREREPVANLATY